MTATTEVQAPNVRELAREIHAAMRAAHDQLARAFELGEQLHNAATGDKGPADERVKRLGYCPWRGRPLIR